MNKAKTADIPEAKTEYVVQQSGQHPVHLGTDMTAKVASIPDPGFIFSENNNSGSPRGSCFDVFK